MYRMILVGIVSRCTVKGENQRMGVGAVDDRPIGIRRWADIAVPHGLDAGQRSQPGFEALAVFVGKPCFEGKIDAVNKQDGLPVLVDGCLLIGILKVFFTRSWLAQHRTALQLMNQSAQAATVDS